MSSNTSSRRPTRMLDIAAEAGVSRATVSLVLRGSPLVAPATRERVRATAERLGYVYNRGAASLRTQRRSIVGLIIPDVSNPFIAQASFGFQTALSADGYFVVVASTLDDAEQQQLILQSLAEHQVDGILLIPAIGTDPHDIRQLSDHGVPIVILNRPLSGVASPYVGPDEAGIATLGIDHLVGVHGVKRTAFFGGIAEATPRIEREKVFRARAAKLGASIDEAWCIPTEATPRGAYEAASRLLDAGAPPAGVMCHSDGVAYGLLKALREHGYSTDDCRVLGVDDLPESPFWNPSVTSVAVNATSLGHNGGRALLELMGHQPAEDPAVSTAALMVRESCGCSEMSVN